jgi:phage baseplate assembly protein V
MASLLELARKLLRIARTSTAVDESGTFPLQQAGWLGKYGKTVPWAPYGYHYSAPVNSLGVLLAIGGDNASRMLLVGSPEKRPTDLVPSEVVIFNPETMSEIRWKADGDIEINALGGENVKVTAPTKVTIDAPDAEFTGNVDIAGNVTVVGTADVTGATSLGAVVTSDSVAIGSTHKHSGVSTGGGTSGNPV